jgi:cell wall-associated NlpC family hydrolase
MRKNRNRSALSAIAVSFSLLLTSCYSSQQATQPSLSKKVSSTPQYLDNLTLNGPERSMKIAARAADSRSPIINPSGGSSLQAKYAALMNVLPDAIRNVRLYNFIDEWYGVRYRLGGNSKDGIDCSAFVQRMYETVFGLNLVRTAMQQFTKTEFISCKEQCKEGDLVFFHVRSRRISHVGIYLMNNYFVHASSSQGIMISNLQEPYWQKYFACAGRML